jgi:hypothetical protein
MRTRTRMYHILESVQYALLYLTAALIGGISLDFAFPHYQEDKSTGTLLKEITYQFVALVLVVYFTRTLVKSVPILFPVANGSSYVPYTTAEFNGEMAMGFIFLGSQLNLIQKIDELAGRVYLWFFQEERKVKADLVARTEKKSN